MNFKCPDCFNPCSEVTIGLGAINSKSDPRLVTEDQQHQGIMITGICTSCRIQHMFMAPILAAGRTEIQIVPDKGVTQKISEEEARRRGLAPAN
jgi:hypothetical protein